jgi:hypothetical protein
MSTSIESLKVQEVEERPHDPGRTVRCCFRSDATEERTPRSRKGHMRLFRVGRCVSAVLMSA